MTDIYLTVWNRLDFTLQTIQFIHERTELGSFQIHVFDNGSDSVTREALRSLVDKGIIVSLHQDSRNTGCVYDKGFFHMMTEADRKYYVVSDNDVFPPKLTPDWLVQMTAIMDAHPNLAFLAPQLPPQNLQVPDMGRVEADIVYCRDVGNTFKLVRREAFPIAEFKPKIGAYGDDAIVCIEAKKKGYEIAFCRNIFCYHAGQCKGWGYNDADIASDPRKANYGEPFVYTLANNDTFEPSPKWRI